MSTIERFGFKETTGMSEGPDAERRLHLVALDYWHELKAGKAMPDFRQLTPEGLSPFRGESLLLDFSDGDSGALSASAHIRFVGDVLASVLSDQAAHSGDGADITLSTEALAATDFGRELLAHLMRDGSRDRPQEFDYEDELIGGRGILMPLSLGDQLGTFIWIVATFDFIAYRTQQAQSDATAIFAEQLADARSFWEATPTLGAGARSALYQTLQSAYKLYEQAESDPAAWKKLLANSGLRQQKRAPFTPSLKLVFGKDHDKTRLTEYAAALAHARRNAISSDDFITWIEGFAGGIKGCVEQERLMKKAAQNAVASDTPSPTLETAATLGTLADIPNEGDGLYVAYVRQRDGKADVVALSPASKQDELRALGLIKPGDA